MTLPAPCPVCLCSVLTVHRGGHRWEVVCPVCGEQWMSSRLGRRLLVERWNIRQRWGRSY